ncbi:MAG: DeoR/GlpR family DNA-binding transcription regulator [Acidimicrobiales bacterium]
MVEPIDRVNPVGSGADAMRPNERHERILQMVSENGRVEVDALSVELGVSAMTMRRDLALLEADGALRRVYGGATRISSGSYEPPFAVRAKLQLPAKRQIARVVASLIDDGQAVILDAGTTGVAIAEQLSQRQITVCTPSLRVAAALVSSSSVRLMVTGGMVRPGEQSLVGPETGRMLEDYHFDLYIMTVSAAHADQGFTEWHPDDAAVKRTALGASSRCIVACDANKIGRTAFARICALNAADLLVTDSAITEEQRSALEAHGLEVRTAGPGDNDGLGATSHNGSDNARSNHGDWSRDDY